MTCPTLVPLALCAALGGEPAVMATSSSRLVVEAPVMTPTAKYHRRHHRAHYYHRRHRAPRVIVRERSAPAPASCPAIDPLPLPRPVPIEIIRSPTAIVRAGFDALRGPP